MVLQNIENNIAWFLFLVFSFYLVFTVLSVLIVAQLYPTIFGIQFWQSSLDERFEDWVTDLEL